jgi:hypothetical protein
MEIETVLQSLKANKPIFHSEKDFQDSLANALESSGFEEVRLEVAGFDDLIGVSGENSRRIDIIIGDKIAIELKYPKDKCSVDYGGQRYDLKGAKSVIKGRYRLWKDVWRVEQLVRHGIVKTGYAIILTNRPFWEKNKKQDWLIDFATHQGRNVSGSLSLRHDLGGVRKEFPEMRKHRFDYEYSYKVDWKEWSTFNCQAGKFKYAIFRCSKRN